MSALNYKKTSADASGSLFAIVDGRIPKGCDDGLLERGFKLIKLRADERLGEAVASHTDMLLFRLGNTLVGSKRYFDRHSDTLKEITDALPHFNLILSDEEILAKYPYDARFNALIVKEMLFAKCDTVSKAILKIAEREGMKTVNVKQGYPACTVLALPCGCAVTSDSGMARALEKNGINTLLIEESGKIKLPPYKNGFIGGTAGILGNTVYFIGNLLAHPSGEKIRDTLARAGYEALSLDPSSDSLFDLGGLMLINTDKNGSNISPKNPKSE